jgi:hypothetical protein
MSNVSVAVRGDCVGLRAAPTRKNSQIISELAGRVTRHCRALAMHGMHVAGDGSQCSESARAKMLRYLLSTVPGALVPCQPFRIYAPQLKGKFIPKFQPACRQSGPQRCHHGSGFRITSFPLLEVGLLHTANRRVHRTPDDPEMPPCMLSYLMATNLHRKVIPIN